MNSKICNYKLRSRLWKNQKECISFREKKRRETWLDGQEGLSEVKFKLDLKYEEGELAPLSKWLNEGRWDLEDVTG